MPSTAIDNSIGQWTRRETGVQCCHRATTLDLDPAWPGRRVRQGCVQARQWRDTHLKGGDVPDGKDVVVLWGRGRRPEDEGTHEGLGAVCANDDVRRELSAVLTGHGALPWVNRNGPCAKVKVDASILGEVAEQAKEGTILRARVSVDAT